MVYLPFISDVHRLLNLSLTSDLVPDQDVIDVIIHVGRNPLGRHLAWRYFREKWDILNSRWMWLHSSLFISDFNLPLSPWYEFHIRALIRYLLVNVILCLVCVWRTESIMGNICWCLFASGLIRAQVLLCFNCSVSHWQVWRGLIYELKINQRCDRVSQHWGRVEWGEAELLHHPEACTQLIKLKQ